MMKKSFVGEFHQVLVAKYDKLKEISERATFLDNTESKTIKISLKFLSSFFLFHLLHHAVCFRAADDSLSGGKAIIINNKQSEPAEQKC
jgi:hypothetical protein